MIVPPIRNVPIDLLREIDGNPNEMTRPQIERLKALIREQGFLQPILVREHAQDAGLDIVDGAHRVRAVQELGESEVPAVVLPHDTPEHVVRALRIALNKLRGELDLADVSAELARIVADVSSVAETATLTGLADDEVASLLEAARNSAVDDALDDAAIGDEPPRDEPKGKPAFALTIEFAKKADMTRAKKELRRLAGKGNPTEAGLMRALFDD